VVVVVDRVVVEAAGGEVGVAARVVVDALDGASGVGLRVDRAAHLQPSRPRVPDRVREAEDVVHVAAPGGVDVGAVEAQVARRQRTQVRVEQGRRLSGGGRR
jgi:hypothetical protein